MNPISKVVDISKFDWAKSITGSKMGMIYALYNKRGKLVKIGMTGNASERLEKYREDDPDFDKNFIMMRIVSFDSITAEVDLELSKLYEKFLHEVIQSSAPQNLKDFYKRILDEWHRGGIKRQQMMQLIETGLQVMYFGSRAGPSEGFMWDESKYNNHRSVAIKAAGEIIGLIAKQGARSPTAFVFAVGTWITGAKPDVLSTGPTALEYIVGNRWRDIIGKALHPNATTAEEIFDDNFSDSTLDHAHKFFEDLIAGYAQMSNRISHIIIDAQDYMYKSLETPQRILHRHGFRRVRTLLGSEIIVFQKENTFIYLHGHLSIAGDSRDFITTDKSQRRAIIIDVLKRVIQYATCQVDAAGIDFDTSAILGSMIMEVSNCGLHGSRRFAAAMFRDMITPSTINAIELFGGENDVGLTPNDIMYPSSRDARHTGNEASSLLTEEVIRRFSHVKTVSKSQLNKFLKQLKVDIEKSITRSNNLGRRWSEIITEFSSVSLEPNLEDRIRKWASNNNVVIMDVGANNRGQESADGILSSLTAGQVLAIPRHDHWNSKKLKVANLPQSISGGDMVVGDDITITVVTSITDQTLIRNAEKVGVKLQKGFRYSYRKNDDLGKALSTHNLTLVKVVSLPSRIESATAKTKKTKSDAKKAAELKKRKENDLDCTEHDWQCKACDTITASVWFTQHPCSNINCTSREKVSNNLPKHPKTENKNWELVETSVPKKAASKTSKSKSSSKANAASTSKSVSKKRSKSPQSSSQPTRSSKRLKSQNTSSLDTTETSSASASKSASNGKKRSRGRITTKTPQSSKTRSSKRSKRNKHTISITSNADSIQAERIQELRDERQEQLREEREYKARIPKYKDKDGLWDNYLVGDEALPHDMDLHQSRSDKAGYFSSLNVGDGAFVKRTSGRWEFTRIIAKIGNTIFFQAGDGWKPVDITIETTFDILRKKI